MNAPPERAAGAAASPAPRGAVLDFERARLVRSLRSRSRYRYVRARVSAVDGGYEVSAPCCSRNVDPDGGVIGIARLLRTADGWQLERRDHARECWVLYALDGSLDELAAMLNSDPERVFWP